MKLLISLSLVAFHLLGYPYNPSHPHAFSGNREFCTSTDINDETTPSAGPRVKNGTNFFITGNFLFWRIQEDGLEFAQSGNPPVAGAPASKGYLKAPSFRTEPGFKAGLGYQLPMDGWDLFLQYTWLKGRGVKTTTTDDMNPLWLRPPIGTLIKASGSWHLQFNNFDLELGRSFYTSSHLTLRPFIGLKSGWHDEDYKVRYLCALSPHTDFVDRIQLDNFLWYLGPRIGTNTNWLFTKSWNLYGNMALSANWSRFKLTRFDQQFLPANRFLRLNTLNTQNNIHTVFPVLELNVGVQWETFFSDSDYHILLALGWEEQVWWGHNRLISEMLPQSHQGNLYMQGLNFQIRFDF